MAEKKKRKTYPDPTDPNLDPREKQMIASSKKLAKCKGLKGKALDACLKPLGRRLGKSGEWELIDRRGRGNAGVKIMPKAKAIKKSPG
tara:strand:- start:235 stop:498 length:264 start_codon:yes stop_codon:yes gene_type:complete